eukprot:GILK01000159.1.p1 GENE.GILK01000159.1~~GILK01000159.1.p1  ORF type:complete len:354 (-),score=86.21 GILK01000159.1:371-1432(-)
MGGCGTKLTPEQAEEQKRNKLLDKVIKNEVEQDSRVIKLLLLGAGESGKSTVFKQMKLLYQKGYSNEERAMFTAVIHNNTISSMQTLLLNCGQKDGEEVLPDNKEAVEKIKTISVDTPLTPELATMIETLWKDPAVRRTYDRRADFQLNDSASYFFDKVKTLGSPSYVPDEQDVLRSRVRTTGIVQNKFVIDGVEFHMYDVGGQRNERKKWMHCFENVTAVIFVASMSEYDQKLYEDENMNRMTESVNLFNEICNSRWFDKTSMILFLNKRDLFEEKIRKVPLTPYFPAYQGGMDARNAAAFIQELYEAQNKTEGKQVYSHSTCATDTSNVSHVFNACKDIILRQNLAGSGFV